MARKNAEQDFLNKPRQRRRRAQTRQYRQEQAQVLGTRPRSARPRRAVPQVAKRLLPALLLVSVLLAVGVYVWSNPAFYVQSAAIRGVQYTTADEIYRQAGIDQYNIFWVNPSTVEKRLEGLPFVRQAQVRTALPNTVRIEIEERSPQLLWHVNGDSYWADREGVALPVADTALALPVLWDLDGSTISTTGRLSAELIASVSQMQAQVPEVIEFGYDRSNGLQFRFPEGTFVYLGQPEGMAQRTAELLALRIQLAEQGTLAAEINWRDAKGYVIRLAQQPG
ncbi:MAG: FtsQ-type POTRA domain-containing protein [Caldilineales bacterium]